MKRRILIVEDEPKLAQLLTDYLVQAQYDVHCIHHGDEVVGWVKSEHVDLILLDLMLPGKDGMSICQELRQFSPVPILMTTAKTEEIDRLLGLELGADDYICKPYSPREVVARVKAFFRRIDMSTGSSPNTSCELCLDGHRFQANLNEQTIDLTAIEFNLLEKLTQQPGRVYDREQLIDCIYKDHRVVSGRTIDSHIKKLRKKMTQLYQGQEVIQSVYGLGYKFVV